MGITAGESALKVVHLVPYDAVGGVEIAARSIVDGAYGELTFSKLYLADKEKGQSENHPACYFRALSGLFLSKPDLVIGSLWRSCVVLVLFKILCPRTKTVAFLHSAVTVHWLDTFLNYLAMWASDEIWSDSHTTLMARIPEKWRHKGRIISFLVDRIPAKHMLSASPDFIFWGRLHSMKGLDRSLRVFSIIQETCPEARFCIVGPDDGQQASLQALIKHNGIKGVDFLGSMDRVDIFKFAQTSSFYLQTSLDEGMAMSVVEAMQQGLVPVVTPVGEIARYCRDGENAVLVHDDAEAVRSVLQLLDDAEAYRKLSHNAVQTWQDKPLYRDDVLEACRHVLVG